jgi:mediator of RNA polymerase II transcription subunit 25
MERLKVLDRDIQILELRIVEAQDTGQGAVLAGLQEDRKAKTKIKEQIKELLKQHYHKALLAKENPNAPAGTVGSALPSGSAEAGPSTPSHPPNAPSASSLPPTSPTVDERKPTAADSQVLTQFWQSRGGTVSTADGGTPQAGPSQTQSHPTVPSEVAAQMQKSKGIRPQSFGPSSQTSGTTSHEIGLNPNAINSQVIQPSNAPSWFGTLLGTFPKNGSQGTIDVQVHVIGVLTTQTPTDVRAEIRMESWPKNFTLNLCKEPFRDQAELSSWLKRHQFRTGLMKFACNPRIPDAPMNEQRFQALTKFMHDHRICACAGWPLPSGKSSYNIFFFAMGPGFLAGTVFPDGIPDLPGSGNVLDTQPPVEQAKPRPPSGLPLPQWLLARMQGLELAKQKQLLAQFVRSQHVDQLRRQQLQQTQQSHNTPGQSLNSLGMTIPQNPYTAVANIPAGLHANVNPPPNSGAYNTGGRTVNYEMLQSFMQRNAEGSPSQGMNPGGVN